jgi:hypothetical protein
MDSNIFTLNASSSLSNTQQNQNMMDVKNSFHAIVDNMVEALLINSVPGEKQAEIVTKNLKLAARLEVSLLVFL